MQPLFKFRRFPAIVLFFLLAGCGGNRFQIPEGLFQRAFSSYQSQLFQLGLSEKVSAAKKRELVQKAGSSLQIPEQRMMQYIQKKYPQHYLELQAE